MSTREECVMTSQTDTYDPCDCSHARFEHIGLIAMCSRCECECTQFRRKFLFGLLVSAVFDLGCPRLLRVSRTVAGKIISLVAPYARFPQMPDRRLCILGAEIVVDDYLPDNEIVTNTGKRFIIT